MPTNIFVSLNVPVTGIGIASDVSNMAPNKTFTASGNFVAPLIVEVSEDGVTWAVAFQVEPPAGEPIRFDKTIVANMMRVRRHGSDSGSPGVVLTVAAEQDLQNVFGTFNVPAADGVGAALDTSVYGDIKTVVVAGGPFSGMLVVEGSADGTTWDVAHQFEPLVNGAVLDAATFDGTWQFMRVRREFGLSPMGLPIVTIGASPCVCSGGDSNYVSEDVTNATALADTLLQGEVVRMNGNLTVDRAVATDASGIHGTIGVVVNDLASAAVGPVITNGKAYVRVQSGLSVAAGDTLWVSDTEAGRATNIQPVETQFVGIVKDASMYDNRPAEGSLVIADVSPMPDFDTADNAYYYNAEAPDGPAHTLLRGEVVLINANNGVVRSLGNTYANVQGTVGVVQSASVAPAAYGMVITSGRGMVKLLPNLVDGAGSLAPRVGQSLWVATTAGLATNVQPHQNAYFLGTIVDVSGYVNPGWTVIAEINPMMVSSLVPSLTETVLDENATPACANGDVVCIDTVNYGVKPASATYPMKGTIGVVTNASVLAVANVPIQIATHGEAMVNVETGVTIAVGDYLWLSATSAIDGRVTNVPQGVERNVYIGVAKTGGAGSVIADLNITPEFAIDQIADWSSTRYFALDVDWGDDTNTGWGNTAAAAALVPKKTLTGLLAALPKFGNNKDALILVAKGLDAGGGARPANLPFTLTLTGLYGYRNISVQGAPYNLPASGFANTTIERVTCGAYVSTPGDVATTDPQGNVAWKVGAVVDDWTYDIVDNAGNPPVGWTANSLRGQRVRLISTSGDATYNGATAMVYSNTAGGRIVLARKLNKPLSVVSTPFYQLIANDTIMFELPGVAFNSVDMDQPNAWNVQLAGISCTGTFGIAQPAVNTVSLHFCGCYPRAGSSYFQAAHGNGISITEYYDGVGAATTDLGLGVYVDGGDAGHHQIFDYRSATTQQSYFRNGTTSPYRTQWKMCDSLNGSTVLTSDDLGLLAGSVVVGGTTFLNNISRDESLRDGPAAFRYATIGYNDANYYKPALFFDNYVDALFGVVHSQCSNIGFDGATIDAATAAGYTGMTFEGNGALTEWQNLTFLNISGAAQIDMTLAVGCTVNYDYSTITMVAAPADLALRRVHDVGLATTDILVNFADIFQMQEFVDIFENHFINTMGEDADNAPYPGVMRAAMVCKADAATAIDAHHIVRASGYSGQFTLIKPTSAVNADPTTILGLLGITVNDCNATPVAGQVNEYALVVTSGLALVVGDANSYAPGTYAPADIATAWVSKANLGHACVGADVAAAAYQVAFGVYLNTVFDLTGVNVYPVTVGGLPMAQGLTMAVKAVA